MTTQHFQFEASRAAGLARLQAFAPLTGKHYAAKRNTDEGTGARGNVSMLSPYLRFRMISEEEVLTTVLERHSLGGAEKFIQEVFWRGYFKGFLEAHPLIWRNYVDAVASLPKTDMYHRAVAGSTGIEGFDDWAMELRNIGYLHNHARMWFASIWIFTLKLPWQLGADFMYRHLIDGDPASNTLSWRWVGGLHTKGKTYLARSDNIAHYTNGRFHPKGLVVVAPALQEPALPPPAPLAPASAKMPDGAFGLLLTGEDLGFEGHYFTQPPEAILMPAQPMAKPGGEESAVALAFRQNAMNDAAIRASTHFGIEVLRLPSLDPTSLAAFCRANAVTTLATPFTPVGPEADALNELSPALPNHGITLLRVRRRHDTLVWPHSTKGFFGLKDKIPGLLEALGIASKQDKVA